MLDKRDMIINYDDLILITGASGFIGTKVLVTLLQYGFKNLRCFVRASSNLEAIKRLSTTWYDAQIDLVVGNLLSANDCNKAAEGATVIYHLAAGMEKTFGGCFSNTVVSTKTLLKASRNAKTVKRFLNVSSFAVYSNIKAKRGSLLDETTLLEDAFMERFDAYCYAKLKQEKFVSTFGEKFNIPYVIVRPGAVYGPGSKQGIHSRIGIDTFGIFMNIGKSNFIPLSYVDNCAEEIVVAGLKKGIDSEVFNIVDDDLPKSADFLARYKENVRNFGSNQCPFLDVLLFLLSFGKIFQRSKGQVPPVFNRRKCSALWKGNVYTNDKLKRLTGWRPRVSIEEGLKCHFEYLNFIRRRKEMRVAIVGCGKQADEHAVLINSMPGCEIVGVCDKEALMAEQLHERFRVKKYYTDLRTMLDTESPDIVHVVTPPHSHLEIGSICFGAGCNVLFEKPFGLNAQEAETLINSHERTK